MALPTKGDRLIAKTRLTFYTDPECKKGFPPVPPGVGYQTTSQFVERLAGEEVGTYTGKANDISFEVDWVQQYRRVPKWPAKPENVVLPRTSFVKISEVTGNWDTGVDAPKITPPPAPDGENDNTNIYLAGAIGVAAFMKFVLPKFRK